MVNEKIENKVMIDHNLTDLVKKIEYFKTCLASDLNEIESKNSNQRSVKSYKS